MTGVRQDAWAKANRIEPEQKKAKHERDKYLHPELFGKKAAGLHDAESGTAPAASVVSH